MWRFVGDTANTVNVTLWYIDTCENIQRAICTKYLGVGGNVRQNFIEHSQIKSQAILLLSWTYRESRIFYCAHCRIFTHECSCVQMYRIKIRRKTMRAIWISRSSRIFELNSKIEKYKRPNTHSLFSFCMLSSFFSFFSALQFKSPSDISRGIRFISHFMFYN